MSNGDLYRGTERVHHWPGVESLTAIDHNVPLTATKPVRFFDPENGDLPDVIDLHFRRVLHRFAGVKCAEPGATAPPS